MKYKVGDKVRVREWDDMEREFGSSTGCINTRCSFTPEMGLLCGKIVTILRIYNNEHYKIEEDSTGLAWTDEMFEDIDKPENRWEKIASWFGLELDEEFDIEDAVFTPYKFTEKGLVNCVGSSAAIWLDGIINDQCKIEKLPWKPKNGDTYYYIRPIDGSIVESEILDYYLFDLAMLKNGWIFKTREEAESNKERILKEYKEVLK